MKPLTDTDPFPFGKHKGKPMSDVPVDYLHWYWHKTDRTNPAVSEYIARNMDALSLENEDLIWTS